MSSPESSADEPAPKRSRKAISIAEKINIIKRLVNGEGKGKLAREYGVNESTIRNIRNQEATIRAAAEVLTPDGANGSLRHRNLRMAKMEACLVTWLEDMLAKRLPVWFSKVRAKSLQLYEEIGTLGYEDEVGFKASNGWFERFKKKYKLSELRPYEDRSPPSETFFKTALKDIISTRKFTRDQIFMAEKTSFGWKRFPGLVDEESANLIICTNASGSLFMPPMLYGDKVSTNPQITFLPPEQSGTMTPEDFHGWFRDCFIPQCQTVNYANDPSRKVLLVLAHDLTYPSEINHPSVDIIRLPPECNSSLLPAVQGMLEHLNIVYLKQVAHKLMFDRSLGKSPEKAWVLFSIDDALELLTSSIEQMDKPAIFKSWANLLDDNMHGLYSNQPILEEIILSAKTLGLGDITESQILNLITPRELSNEEAIELYHKRQSDSNEQQFPPDGTRQKRTYKTKNSLKTSIEEMDNGVRLALVEEIDRHVAALLEAKEFFERHDHAKVRAEAISKRLHQVCRWAEEMRKEIQPSDELSPVDLVQVKNEPLTADSGDEGY